MPDASFKPGLSSFAGSPTEAAAASLDVLMDEAMRVVPAVLRKCIPVAVKVTAGLRLLSGSQSGAPAHRVPVPLPQWGVFAWVTVHYLLATMRADTPPKTPTYAVLDLGGASAQIVFAPVPDAPLQEGEHKHELDFGGKKRVLYQHSYLGSASCAHARACTGSSTWRRTLPGPPSARVVRNPCLAQGTRRTIELVMPDHGTKPMTMAMDVGGFDACSRLVTLVMVLAKDTMCAVRPCAIHGVYQPALSDPADAGACCC
ncbi:nucleoside phosphatase family-domain-containing protein [Mycena latifolia]|nr:nucleoside phosphatase family-domain-containing protein [Mycena latifolia]